MLVAYVPDELFRWPDIVNTFGHWDRTIGSLDNRAVPCSTPGVCNYIVVTQACICVCTATWPVILIHVGENTSTVRKLLGYGVF